MTQCDETVISNNDETNLGTYSLQDIVNFTRQIRYHADDEIVHSEPMKMCIGTTDRIIKVEIVLKGNKAVTYYLKDNTFIYFINDKDIPEYLTAPVWVDVKLYKHDWYSKYIEACIQTDITPL